MPKIIVSIEWDEPDDVGWLPPDNIIIALGGACPNTKFKVKDLGEGISSLVGQAALLEATQVSREGFEVLGRNISRILDGTKWDLNKEEMSE